MDEKDILEIIRRHGKNKGALIAILEEIQRACTYLPEDALRLVARETGHSLTDIYGVATFYKAFSLKPRGRHCVSVCMGTACHVRGAQKIVTEFSQELGIRPGETTPDNETSLETVNCLGACALGPTVVADGRYFPHVGKGRVKEIITMMKEGMENTGADADGRMFPLNVSCPSCGKSLMDPDHFMDGHPSVRFDFSCNGDKGWMRLSSLYGSHAVALEHEAPANALATLSCPHCMGELPSFSRCPECGASMAALLVGDGCSWEICTRSGCRGHLLNLDQTNLRENR
jgi:NADH-quinone oxidoreductase subunit E